MFTDSESVKENVMLRTDTQIMPNQVHLVQDAPPTNFCTSTCWCVQTCGSVMKVMKEVMRSDEYEEDDEM